MGTVLIAIEEYLPMRETAEILADPEALRGLAEAQSRSQRMLPQQPSNSSPGRFWRSRTGSASPYGTR